MKIKKNLLVFAMALAFPVALFAETIQKVEVEGVKRIEAETVKSYLTIKEGGSFTPQAVRDSISALYATGFFKDVSIDRAGGKLVVRVVENPMVNRMEFKGSDEFKAEELEKIVSMKSREIFKRQALEKDLENLRQIYRSKGFFLAKVDAEVKELDQNRVDVTYQISEGDKSKVQEVRIIGNEAFSDRELRKALLVQQSDWLSWFTDNDLYDREKLTADKEQLRNFYMDNGYVRAKVDSSVAELTADKQAFIVTHTVTEGERYRVGQVDVEGDMEPGDFGDPAIKNRDDLIKRLSEQLEVFDGEWFSRMYVRNTVENLTDLVGDVGYAFVDVNPETIIDDENRKVDIHFKVSKGQRVYVNRIQITGNTRTRDEVIRRELRFSEGDRFSTAKVRDSKKQLTGLDFFEKVEVENPTTDNPDRVDVNVKVEEKSTGAFTVGAGYSSQEQFLGTATVSQRNFLGRGQQLSLSFMLSQKTSDFNFAFTEPYFLGENISAGFDLYNVRSDRDTVSSYKLESTGGALRAGFRLSDHWSDNVRYALSKERLKDVQDKASDTIKMQAEESPYIQSMISNSILWDNVDSKLEPTSGRRHKLTTDYAGLGGDIHFGRLLLDNNFFYPVSEKNSLIAHFKARFGVIEGFGEDVPAWERFYLGGSQSVRGFKPGGIGAHTTEDDAMGGNMFEQVNAEFSFPFWGLADKGVRGFTFMDAGYLHQLDEEDNELEDDGGIRMSVGAGINWNSPFGPLRISVGLPILKGDEDETQTFDFSVGTFL